MLAFYMENQSKQSSGKKGGARPGAGRPKGSLDKGNAAIRDMIVQALDRAGGVEYLERMANEHPSTFATLIAKVMPTQVDANVTARTLPASVDDFV